MTEGTGKRAQSTARHIITLSPELDEQLDRALDAWLQGNTIRATGEAVKGFLSNPANGVYILGLVTLVTGAFVGKEGIGSVIDFFTQLQTVYDASPEDRNAAAGDLAESMRALIRFFTIPQVPLP